MLNTQPHQLNKMIEIRREDFSVDGIKRMKASTIGALSIYPGTVREFPEGVGLEFEGNDQAAQRLGQIRERAIDRFDVGGCSHNASSEFLGRIREYCTVSSLRVPQRVSFQCLQKHNRRRKRFA